MKRLIILLSLLALVFGCLSAQEMKAVTKSKIAIQLKPASIQPITRDVPEYQFFTTPTALLTTYWDYMVGGYSSPAVRVQSSTAGDGVYLTYMGQRTASGQRRVFYTYVQHDGTVEVNNEITSTQVKEGYSSMDLDRLSGKPIFAWHVDADPSDTQLEVDVAWDAFLEGIPGLISDPTIAINNPTALATNSTSDNEFIWPNVQIGPSPIADHRRVYVSATNSVSHTVGTPNPSENQVIAYADFTPAMLENGEALTWSYTSIPTLDAWNVDQNAWRRPFYANFVGDDGKYYIAGHHVAYDASVTYSLGEPYVDVFVNSNYGVGEWAQYSMNPDTQITNPVDPLTGAGYFTDSTTGEAYDHLNYAIDEGGHTNLQMDSYHKLHFPLVTALSTPDSLYWYPLTSDVKDVVFDTQNNTFVVCDLYPKDINPNDGTPSVPWNLDGNGPQFTTVDDGINPPYNVLQFVQTWPYQYWDNTAVDSAMRFHYNWFHMSQMNEHDQMVAVWADCTRSYLYNTYASTYPELSTYQNVPEVYISIYPVIDPNHTDAGLQWSEPISLNSVETPQLTQNNNPMVPEWVYPGDYVEYISTDENGYRTGRVHLMFLDDNSWGAASISPAVGQADGGRIMYASLDIKWPPVVGINDPVAPNYSMLKQNFPNPFNPSTTISFNLPKASDVTLNVYNVKGQLVKTLVKGSTPAGNHTINWNGTNSNNEGVGSGIYFYTLKTGNHTETRKMMLVK
ncbi:MAG TPA: FlgD immunoglobulin-like domain containing protein [Candidatus Cloacimonadota bacterium]|nr:FlgD immunoglobulin-like domain containing protein [Candidatus Cloacimonadota bacterium]HPT70654.1 FlgD immunoglobulin-like domain containing protein [Candidatus Cloacimonadota bacterium]